MSDFRSDNTLGCSPEILEALARESRTSASAYGNDPVTERLLQRCRELFETDLDILPVATGTAGNALALASMSPTWGGIFCHEDAHVHRDELGAPEFFSGGAKVIPLPGIEGRIDPQVLAESIDEVATARRMATPSALSLTQATEAGTVYTPDQITALTDVARARELGVHMDGARFANAVVSTRATPAELTWKAGVDVLVFGATKNGAMAAELLVIFRRTLTSELASRLHRSGHRFSKMRFLSAQLDAYLSDDLWLRNARHANNCAATLLRGLRSLPEVEILRPTEANVIFARLSSELIRRLQTAGFLFYDWPIFGDGAIRLVCGFNTRIEDVEHLLQVAGSTTAATATAGAE